MRRAFTFALVVIAQASPAQGGAAQTPDSRRGRSQVLEAIDALGGLPKLRAVSSLAIHAKGTVFRSAQVQGIRPGVPSPAPRDEWLAFDVPTNRAALEYNERRTDGSQRWRRFAYAGNERIVVEFVNRYATRMPFPDAPRLRRDLMRRVPQFLLLECYDHPDSLRTLGDSVAAGRTYHVVAYAAPDHKATLHLFINAANRRLEKVAYSVDFPGLGDARAELTFGVYVPHALLGAFPIGHTIAINGDTFETLQYAEVITNDLRVSDAFRIPNDIAAQSMGFGGPISQPAPGVYVMNTPGGFTTMFVEFRDFLLAVEAPAQGYVEFDQVPADGLWPSDTVSEWLIRQIKTTVPNKPIRYLAVSHYHNDHAGGARAFWAEGATLLTTPGTHAYFEQLGRAHVSIRPDRLSRLGSAAATPIEVVDTTRTITDGSRTVQIINVGRTLHTDEALAVYLPQDRFLYQGDQFYFDNNAMFPARDRVPIMREFAQWLTRTRLPVERIYGTHMTGYATMEHVNLILQWPAFTIGPARNDGPAATSDSVSLPPEDATAPAKAAMVHDGAMGHGSAPSYLRSQTRDGLNARLDSVLSAVVAAGELSGTILIRQRGHTLAERSYGWASRELRVANRNDTRFMIGSIAKQFTAAAILLLEEQGKLKTSDTLEKYVRGFPSGDKITLLHLLTHTSGVSRDLPDPSTSYALPHTTAEMVELIRHDTLLFAPGTRRSYSNNAYRILGYVIERVSGKPYAAFLDESFFRPLGMRNTGQLEEQSLVSGLASGYTPGFGPDGYGLARHLDNSNGVGAGSLYSTVEDLYTWSEQFLIRGAVRRAVRDRMLTGRGIGTVVDTALGQRIVWHNGVYQGYTALLETFPDVDLTIVYLGNTETAASQDVLQNALNALALRGKTAALAAPPVAPSPTGPLAAEYTGVYHFPSFGLRLSVGTRDGKLVLEGLPVECLARDSCYYRLKGAAIVFTRDSTGRVAGLKWTDPGGTYPAVKEP